MYHPCQDLYILNIIKAKEKSLLSVSKKKKVYIIILPHVYKLN